MSNTTEDVIAQNTGTNSDEKANIPVELVTFLVTSISLMIVAGKLFIFLHCHCFAKAH